MFSVSRVRCAAHLLLGGIAETIYNRCLFGLQYNDLLLLAIRRVSAFYFAGKSGTNSPSMEEWKFWLAWAEPKTGKSLQGLRTLLLRFYVDHIQFK